MNPPENNTVNFHEESYKRHANWSNVNYASRQEKIDKVKIFREYSGSINHWAQQIFFNCLKPLIVDKHHSWLTVGDANGHDASFLLDEDIDKVVASDINGEMLVIAEEFGYIKEFAIQNAEKLSYADNSFDFVLCKESYHHFPRPYAAMYEMIRVAQQGVVVLEPQDPVQRMPLLLLLTNFLGLIDDKLVSKIWKNRFSYETVGNFVYKISEREFEKLAGGLGLPTVAVKKINPNFWFPGSHEMPANTKNAAFRKIVWKKKFLDFFSRIGLIPSQQLCIVVFKQRPDENLRESLKKNGYKLIDIPKNPYV